MGIYDDTGYSGDMMDMMTTGYSGDMMTQGTVRI